MDIGLDLPTSVPESDDDEDEEGRAEEDCLELLVDLSDREGQGEELLRRDAGSAHRGHRSRQLPKDQFPLI